MIWRIALTVAIVVAGASPARARNHPRSHVRSYPHGPDHVRPDSVTHAAMHAALHGNWTGTLSGSHGVSSELVMSITHDSLRNVTVTLRANREIAAGDSRDFVVRGNQLQWRQDVAGTLCKVTAVMSTATPVAHDTMNGRITCEGSELTFSLRKKT